MGTKIKVVYMFQHLRDLSESLDEIVYTDVLEDAGLDYKTVDELFLKIAIRARLTLLENWMKENGEDQVPPWINIQSLSWMPLDADENHPWLYVRPPPLEQLLTLLAHGLIKQDMDDDTKSKVSKGFRHFPQGLSVRELKELVKDWPDLDREGEPNTVWIDHDGGLSSPIKMFAPLNLRVRDDGTETADILLGKDLAD